MNIAKDLVPIERREGVTLYGRVIGPGGKLGRYEVYSKHLGNNGAVYNKLSDAQQRFKALIGVEKK